ncbi:GAK system CofD-like protein [Algibacillus agarilyticus]|uniref:GAK system CofD-like protein n=1 Tax=Algibacillus agarilyticus TaxID=2234133 RepID=UPI000DD0D611|nr:GAK system CofD-like protein [Algibacillus agarilyticus]
MRPVKITRNAQIPDRLRISRYQKNPELGPQILFFSGGSALNAFSHTLKKYTHNSIHLVTPFDSGGSSAELRKAFNMPAIGDLRSRLMALADESVLGHPEIYRLFSYRLDKKKSQAELRHQLEQFINGTESLVSDIANPMRRVIRNQLGYFYDAMPDNFNLKGASVGNLILTGGYLNNHEHLDPIIFLFSKLVNVQGTVRAVVNDDLHIRAKLKNGEVVLGQHMLTGKEAPKITSPITELKLSESLNEYIPATAELQKKNRKLIENAEIICFSPGSFYSSLLANLLPYGVASAISLNGNPKVYIPNLGNDPEQVGMTLEQNIDALLKALIADISIKSSPSDLLQFVLLDSKNGHYFGGVPSKKLNKLGIKVIDTALIRSDNPTIYDNELLCAALLSLT